MAKFGSKKDLSLVKIVQERVMLKEAEEKEKNKELDVDCISFILLRLPIKAVLRSRCVCKQWYDMIHSPFIINSHAVRSKPIILLQTSTSLERMGSSLFAQPAVKEKIESFSVEASLVGPNNFFNRPDTDSYHKVYLRFVEIVEGEGVVRDYNISSMGRIVASCNGLILLENKLKKGGVILMNPVTRKLAALPVGTISQPHEESYGLVFDPCTTVCKVVHLFSDESGYTSCEIIEVGGKSWRMVDGPSFGLISWFGYKPVSTVGALHWLPHIDHNDYIVSMATGKESFKTIELPESGRMHDRLLEMGGFLCFCAHEGNHQINIWELKSFSDDNWTRLYSFTIRCYDTVRDMVPISASRSDGVIIFTRDKDGALHIYDFHHKVLNNVAIHPLGKTYLSHVNTLVSWCGMEGTICK